MTDTRQARCSAFPHAASGQAGLVAIAVSMVVALVLAATTLSGLSYLNASRIVATKLNLQTYYAAQAGIQEAIATRMLPRSNYLSMAGSPKAYYTSSGKVYRNPAQLNKPESQRTGLVSMYRYVVLGGDAARKSDGTWYSETDTNPYNNIPWLLETETIPNGSPFIVISSGMTCKKTNKRTEITVDKLNPGISPTCKTGYEKDEITLVALVRLNQPSATGIKPADKVERFKVYKDKTKLRLPANAYVPGMGWTTTNTNLNFETLWNNSGGSSATTDPVRLEKVVFYNFTDDSIIKMVDVTGQTTNIPGTIPSSATIRLYFNGPIDYRSIDPTNNKSLNGCKNNADKCRIRVVSNPPMTATNHAYANNTIIPLFPSSTQIILLPPLNNSLPSGTPHEIQVDAKDIRYAGNNATGSSGYVYKVAFTTK